MQTRYTSSRLNIAPTSLRTRTFLLCVRCALERVRIQHTPRSICFPICFPESSIPLAPFVFPFVFPFVLLKAAFNECKLRHFLRCFKPDPQDVSDNDSLRMQMQYARTMEELDERCPELRKPQTPGRRIRTAPIVAW